MIDCGSYIVWTISCCAAAPTDWEDWVRVTLKAVGRADCIIDCHISQAPMVGSEVVLGWR